MNIANRVEGTRLGWWVERFWHWHCFRHDWLRESEYEDTGYSHVVIQTFDECQKCGAWRRVP